MCFVQLKSTIWQKQLKSKLSTVSNLSWKSLQEELQQPKPNCKFNLHWYDTNSSMQEKKCGCPKEVSNRASWVLVLMKETFTEMPLNGKFKQSSKNSKEYGKKEFFNG